MAQKDKQLMAKHEIELYIKGTYLSMIECDDGSLYEEDCPEFTSTKLPGTENFDTEALTTFVQNNIKAIWDGELDNPEHFTSYKIKKIDGPSGAFYEDGMNLRSIAVIIEIETEEDVDELDFDDFFHAIVFELVSENMTFTFTRFDNYSTEIIE